jgi:hypothetical protein
MSVPSAPAAPPPWWGSFHVPLGGAARWRIGPLQMTVRRQPWAWSVTTCNVGPWDDPNLSVAEPCSPDEPDPPGARQHRFTFGETADPLQLDPRLPDRTVVATSPAPFHLLPGEDCLSFVSVPLWMAIRVGPEKKLAIELPIKRPPDTWLGPNTMEGQLCYGSRDPLQQVAARVPGLSHRATIPLRLVNRSSATFQLDRVRVPVPNLSLWAGSDGRLWTPTVTVQVERGGQAGVELAGGAPEVAGPCGLLAAARQESGGMVRAIHTLSAMFGR